jgi:hypothetical protein
MTLQVDESALRQLLREFPERIEALMVPRMEWAGMRKWRSAPQGDRDDLDAFITASPRVGGT